MLWLELANIIFWILLALYIKNYLPSYFGKKGENLATKEDIEEITRLTEEVQNIFKREFEEYKKDRSFKYEYFYEQFSNLYTVLYSIIIQSEYVRDFIKLIDGTSWDFDTVPFIELHKEKYSQNTRINGKDKVVMAETTITTDGVTEFNKKAIADIIVENGKFASQRLLKLAVAYRFVHQNYGQMYKENELVEIANDQEIVLIKEIVLCIVQEYNLLRKELKLGYVEEELNTGLFKSVL